MDYTRNWVDALWSSFLFMDTSFPYMGHVNEFWATEYKWKWLWNMSSLLSHLCSSIEISPWACDFNFPTSPGFSTLLGAVGLGYGLMVGWGPCTCIFHKFPGNADIFGLGTTELEYHLMLVHRDNASKLPSFYYLFKSFIC